MISHQIDFAATHRARPERALALLRRRLDDDPWPPLPTLARRVRDITDEDLITSSALIQAIPRGDGA